MIKEIQLIPFDYSIVTVSDRNFLQETTGKLRLLSRSTALSAVAIGTHLKNVYDRLPMNFRGWVESETSFTISHAFKMIRAAEEFGVLTTKQLELFDSTALLVLSGWNVRKDVRKMAISLAIDGEKISGRKAKEIVNCFKTKTIVEKKDVKEYFDTRKIVDKRTNDMRPKSQSQTELAWDAYKRLVDTNSSVHTERMIDDDSPEDGLSNPWMVRVMPINGRIPKTTVSSDSLETCILNAAGMTPMQECKACGKMLKLHEDFSRKKSNLATGRATSCRKCEVPRVHESKKRSAAKRFQSLKPVEEVLENPNPAQ